MLLTLRASFLNIGCLPIRSGSSFLSIYFGSDGFSFVRLSISFCILIFFFAVADAAAICKALASFLLSPVVQFLNALTLAPIRNISATISSPIEVCGSAVLLIVLDILLPSSLSLRLSSNDSTALPTVSLIGSVICAPSSGLSLVNCVSSSEIFSASSSDAPLSIKIFLTPFGEDAFILAKLFFKSSPTTRCASSLPAKARGVLKASRAILIALPTISPPISTISVGTFFAMVIALAIIASPTPAPSSLTSARVLPSGVIIPLSFFISSLAS